MSKKVKRLYEGFQPAHYQLKLDPDRNSLKLSGTVTISGKKTGRPSQRLTFHQKGLTITGARIIKHDKRQQQSQEVVRISHHQSYNEVRLHTDEVLYPGKYTVTLEFRGTITEGMHGVYPCNYTLDGQKKQLIATQFESHHAREAFPCIDEPEAKATFDLTLLSPKGETALSNMPALSQSEAGDKQVTTFETTPVMSTYLLAFVYGDLHHKEAATESGVTVRVWATKAQPAASLDFALDVAKRSIEFFNDYFGTPYPLSKCDHIALPDFSSGAMENWGLITYREACLLANPETTSQSSKEMIATVIAHETSHQWFGNLVTMRWWDDLWLNESFANVMEYVAVDALFPDWHIWNTFTAHEGLSALRRDSIPGVQAVKTEVRHPDEISTLFDPSIVYAKGGRLLNMLMHYVGQDNFRTGLKAYFAAHAYGNTTGDDLWAALSAASGKDIASFMNPWLNRSGFPVISVSQEDQNLVVQQAHFVVDPSKADASRVWPVPLLSGEPSLPGILDSAKKTYSLKRASVPVRINCGAVGHYMVRYKDDHLKQIAAMAEQKTLPTSERLMLLSDSTMLARAGVQSFGQALKLLAYYKSEDDEAVWDIMALVIADCRRFIDIDEALEAPIKSLIRELIEHQYQRLSWSEKRGESSQDTKLRATILGLGVYADHPEIVKQALSRYEQNKENVEKLPGELRSIICGAAVRNQVPGALASLLAQDQQSTNADLKHDIASAVALTKDARHIDELLGRLKDANLVRPQDIDRNLVYLLRNRFARRQAWDWLQANWKWIEETFKDDKSYDSLPRYVASIFSTQPLLIEYKAFFEPLADQPALARNITMGIEEIEHRAAWLQRDLADVAACLDRGA